MEKSNLYNVVKGIADTLQLNHTLIIDKPEDLRLFRIYLSKSSAISGKQYITKVKGNKLLIKHIDF